MALTLHVITFIAMNRFVVEKLNMFTKLLYKYQILTYITREIQKTARMKIYLFILRQYLNRYFAI